MFISELSILSHWAIYLYALDCHIFVVTFEIEKCDSSNFVLPFQDFFG